MSPMRAPEKRLAPAPADSRFELVSDFKPQGDQPTALAGLREGIRRGDGHQVLLGVTGSGKTFTMASVLAQVNRPALVLAHNKTLAAQLYQEFRGFFPKNAVEYFVSYYDYYQPEAYVPQSDTYIDKEAIINDEIDRMRLSATRSLFERRDVIIVASVSCIYGLGSPESYYGMLLFVRTMFDLEMLREVGHCHGIENYSRHLSGRLPGEPPPTLLDYLPKDALMIIDESHQSVPQVRAMFHGDRQRKSTLVEFGFRLPSALDNRPLSFEEFEQRVGQAVYVSATPGPYELQKAGGVVVEQVIRPTGLIDPQVSVRPVKGQVDDLLAEIRMRVAANQRVLVTTLTKRMAEDLTEYYHDLGVRVRYLHSDIETLERVKILRDLRKGEFDVLVGINLLRERLDLPDVSLDAILDADKEGFLRSAGSLIQTMGRAARNVQGLAILYADLRTDSMKAALGETSRRRVLQEAYNQEDGITPESIKKNIGELLSSVYEADYAAIPEVAETPEERYRSLDDLEREIKLLEKQMREAAKALEFEKAAKVRDQIKTLRAREFGLK